MRKEARRPVIQAGEEAGNSTGEDAPKAQVVKAGSAHLVMNLIRRQAEDLVQPGSQRVYRRGSGLNINQYSTIRSPPYLPQGVE